MAGAIVNVVILIPFLIIAVIFSKGKGAALIAGYNTMSNKEKAQYDEVAMCKFMGKIMYGICFTLLLFTIGAIVDENALFNIGLILMFALVIFAIVYTNTKNRFKKNV